MRFQQTIGSPVSCSGVGLHSGQPVTLTLRQLLKHRYRLYLSAWIGRNAHPASISNKVPTELCTAISIKAIRSND